MTPKALRAPDYLDHILQAIGRIQRYTRETTQEAFLANEQQQDAVIRNIEIIGEASRNLQRQAPDSLRSILTSLGRHSMPCEIVSHMDIGRSMWKSFGTSSKMSFRYQEPRFRHS
jgi:hypothetical protein